MNQRDNNKNVRRATYTALAWCDMGSSELRLSTIADVPAVLVTKFSAREGPRYHVAGGQQKLCLIPTGLAKVAFLFDSGLSFSCL